MITCSQCCDKYLAAGKIKGFDGISPQSTCEQCGRECLGYVIYPESRLRPIENEVLEVLKRES